jgi:hypothetical protein
MDAERIIEQSPELLVKLSSKAGEDSVFLADQKLAEALRAWKQMRLKCKLAKAAEYKEQRKSGATQVDAQAEAREKYQSLSEQEIELEAEYYKSRAQRDYLNNKLITVRQLSKYHEAKQD